MRFSLNLCVLFLPISTILGGTIVDVSPSDDLQQILNNLPSGIDTTVNLLPGRHELSAPLVLTKKLNGLTFTGSSEPWSQNGNNTETQTVISGGRALKFYKCVSDKRFFCAGTKGFDGANCRHLFVNGRRARRGYEPDSRKFFDKDQELIEVSDDKYVVKAEAIANWDLNNAGNVEMVYSGQGSPWSESRCTVDHLVEGGAQVEVFMKQPCFHVLQNKPYGQSTNTPDHVENVGTKVLTEGQWFFDESSGTVIYHPLPEEVEEIDRLEAIMPLLEYLIDAEGVKDLSFKGVSFEHATYTRVNSDRGYVEQQSGGLVDEKSTNDDTSWYAMPSNVRFVASENIQFDSCIFRRLGAGGLEFNDGSSHCGVKNSLFVDISGAAIQIGNYQDFAEKDESKHNHHIEVVNNIITDVATELHGNSGISVGYVRSLKVASNTISELSYSGISIGWGWDRVQTNETYAADNIVAKNLIKDYKLSRGYPSATLGDGGGIYFLGPQMNSRCEENWISNLGYSGGGGHIYPDQGSAHWRYANNVVSNSSFCVDDCQWLHLWTDSIHNITVDKSFVDTNSMINAGVDCNVTNTLNIVEQNGGEWPSEAVDIMNSAGAK